ncbi:MAG: N-acetyl-gamma-glutamyl-phosphate reductase [Clostridia bacterium]
MIKVGIIGATGYTGGELVRLLLNHPETVLTALTTTSQAGMRIADIYPALTGYTDEVLVEADVAKTVELCDVVFVALPHGHAVAVGREVLKQNKKMIDLGADFRLKDSSVYEEWYKVTHDGKEMLADAVYALPELHRAEIKGKSLIANPGCYPTSIILALAPLLQAGIINPHTLVIDAKSGMSGAGKKLTEATHYVEMNDNVDAYGVGNHRHIPEIEQELARAYGAKFFLSFTPHHMPITRGILSSMYADLTRTVDEAEVRALYEVAYGQEQFVHLLKPNIYPHTKWVAGSNNCHLNFKIDPRTNRIILISAIDNLLKGASGQAVQNMNILFDLPEETGLKFAGLMP